MSATEFVSAWSRRVLFGGLFVLVANSASGAPGDPLGPAFTVSSDPGETAGVISVASSRDGDFVALLSGDSRLLARVFAADGTPRTDNFPINGVSANGDIAISDNGDVVACWLQSGPDGALGVYARRFTSEGVPLGDEMFVGGPDAPRFGQVSRGRCSVAVDAEGDFVVGWSEGQQRQFGGSTACVVGRGLCVELDDYKVKLRRYTRGGTRAQRTRTLARSAEYRVSLIAGVVGGSDIRSVDVDMAPDGTFVAAWNVYGGSAAIHLFDGTYVQRFSALGLPGIRQVVSLSGMERVGTSTPSVSMADDGSYVVAYRTRSSDPDDLSRNVSARVYPAFGFAGPAFQVNDAGLKQSSALNTAMDAAGNFVIGWSDWTDDNRAGYVQRHARGGGALGVNFTVDPGAETALVAMGGNGDFLVTWFDRDSDQAMARLYDGP